MNNFSQNFSINVNAIKSIYSSWNLNSKVLGKISSVGDLYTEKQYKNISKYIITINNSNTESRRDLVFFLFWQVILFWPRCNVTMRALVYFIENGLWK